MIQRDTVARVEVIPVQLPERREWTWRGLAGRVGRVVVVRLWSEAGLVGLGEATPHPDVGGDYSRYGGETVDSVVNAIEQLLGPALVGCDPFDSERIVEVLDRVLAANLIAKSAVEMALYDLQGHIAGQPVHKLLGGAYRRGVVLAHTIGLMPLEEAIEESRAAVAEGCRALHVKASGDAAADARLVGAVRAAAGEDVTLWVDVNQGYRSNVKAAVQACKELVAAGADLLEQPTEGPVHMAAVTRAVPVPVIADESLWHHGELRPIIEGRVADGLSIYVGKAGGITSARRIATVAQVFDLPCNMNGAFVSGVVTAASLHLAVAMPAVTLPCSIPASGPLDGTTTQVAGRYFIDDLITVPLTYTDGMLLAPDGPGLGVEIDEEKLEKWRT